MVTKRGKNVCVFIGMQKYNPDGTTEYIVKATGFWVLIPIDRDIVTTYLVTAKHNILKIKNLGMDKVYLKFNLHILKAFWEEVDVKDWILHPEDTVDVAVLPFSWKRYGTPGHTGYPLDRLGEDDFSETPRIGIGDEVFIPGLFYPHSGEERVFPIVRIGNIAAMPEEPINTRLGKMEAYLIEARSIGGLSGSPVFANLTVSRNAPQKYYLIGLVHGHFDEHLIEDHNESESQREARINMGIAIVTPVSKIRETIYELPASQAYINRARARLPDVLY